MHVSITRRLVAPLALATLFLVGAGSAHASLLVAPGEDCNQYSSSQVFMPWADVANYTLAPGANFENAASSWDVSNASVVNENEPYNVGGANDNKSLAIADGGVATSPAMCVGLQNPDLRVFYKRTSGTALSSSLRVDALFQDANGNTQSLTIGSLTGSGAWTLSPQMVIVANLLPLLDNGTPVAFRFTATGGSFQIDDAYVDPWGKG